NRGQSASCRSAVGMPSLAAPATRSGLSSQAMTFAPPAASARAVAIPEPPRPKRATSLPLNVVTGIILSQLQRRKADQRQDHGDDPETDDDLALGPAELFEMVMDGGHQEDALAGRLESGNLDDHRQD